MTNVVLLDRRPTDRANRTEDHEVFLYAPDDAPTAPLFLLCDAEAITADSVNFLATHGRGLIHLVIDEECATRMGIVPMVATPTNARCAAFARSIESVEGVTTGISAADRARTMRVACCGLSPAELVSPGHVFPIIARKGDAGPMAMALPVARRLFNTHAATICSVLLDDGNVASVRDVPTLSWASGLPLCFASKAMKSTFRPSNPRTYSTISTMAYHCRSSAHSYEA